MRIAFALAGLLVLGACGGAEDQEDALSADEDRQLNEAAAMLDEGEEEEEPTPAPPANAEGE